MYVIHPKPFRSDLTSATVVLRFSAAILANARLLEDFAERCGQAGAMHWLQHFLAVPTFRGKRPLVVIGLSDEDVPTLSNLRWAVLVYELAPGGLGTGIFSTDDISGYRTVIAAPTHRYAAAAEACNALLQVGAQIIMLSTAHSPAAELPSVLTTSVSARWALRSRPVNNTLRTEPTYEATLRTLGKATRFNMRYYRRRLLRHMQFAFIPDARELVSQSETVAMNQASLNPFEPGLALMQYNSCLQLEGGFLLGLRATGGPWLSLVGGWRQADTTVLLWQMNRSGLERFSIGTVMRSYFVQHEVERGAQRILFYGGTPNSIEHSFVADSVTDIFVVRNTLRARLLSSVLRLLGRPRWFMQNPNFIARSVSDPSLRWHQTQPATATDKIETA